MATNVIVVAGTATLTKEPEGKQLPSGTLVCDMRGAYSTGRKNPQSGQWEDKPNYIDFTIFGNQVNAIMTYLHKGSHFAFSGRLEYEEWQAKDGSGTRSKHKIIIDQMQFLHSAPPGGYQQQPGQAPPPQQQPQWGPPAGQAPPPAQNWQQPPGAQPPAAGAQYQQPGQAPPPGQQQVWTPPQPAQAPPPQSEFPGAPPPPTTTAVEDDIPF